MGLRRDAKLFDLPVTKTGQRGRPRKFGKNRISLKTRAAARRGWQIICYCCPSLMVERRYKTLLATCQVVGGTVQVVLLEHTKGNWAAYISTHASMSVEMILRTVSDRGSIEEQSHDLKEI